MNWIFRGITIDWSDENENASDSIRVKCEFDSNAIEESEEQLKKHFDPTISTFLGIKIDWRDENETLQIQFVSSVNLIQMRLMKVIDKMRNISIQKFQYSLQCQLQMISKNFELICDREYQSESHFQ
jgi:hypothetical protein